MEHLDHREDEEVCDPIGMTLSLLGESVIRLRTDGELGEDAVAGRDRGGVSRPPRVARYSWRSRNRLERLGSGRTRTPP